MVPRTVYIQGLLEFKVEVKRHVILIPAHLAQIANSVFRYCEFCAVSTAIAHVVKQFVKLFAIYSTVSRSVSTCAHFMKHHYTVLPGNYSSNISAVLTTDQTGHWHGAPKLLGPPTDATSFFTLYFLKNLHTRHRLVNNTLFHISPSVHHAVVA